MFCCPSPSTCVVHSHYFTCSCVSIPLLLQPQGALLNFGALMPLPRLRRPKGPHPLHSTLLSQCRLLASACMPISLRAEWHFVPCSLSAQRVCLSDACCIAHCTTLSECTTMSIGQIACMLVRLRAYLCACTCVCKCDQCEFWSSFGPQLSAGIEDVVVGTDGEEAGRKAGRQRSS